MKPQLCRSNVQHAFRLAHLALLTICAFVAFAALSAVAATPEWTGTAWTSPITPAADNILSPAYLETSTYNDAAVCDHVYDINGEFSGNHAIIWNLPRPATVSAVTIYGGWKDTGRADLYVTSVSVKYSADGPWVVLDNSSANFYGSQLGTRIKARLTMTDGSTLASGIAALKITFPRQQNGYVGIYEIELSGAFDEPLDPEVFPYTFDFGNYDPATWTPSAGNMMGLCTSIKRDSSDITGSCAFMKDGSISAASSFQIYPGNLITWNFSTAFTLDEFKVFSRWNDTGRDAIVIYSFEVRDANDVWHTVFDASHPVILGTTSSSDQFTASGGARGGTGHLWFRLARGDGDPIATDVTAIRVRAGYKLGLGGISWNESCWNEVEAIGSIGSAAFIDEGSVTVTNDCWEVVWSAKLSSLGDGDSAIVNLLTSTDNETFTLADSRTATEVNTAYWFTNVFDSVGMTIWYKFETINSSGAGEWRTTNEVASVVNHDNATYWWRPDVASGAWEDGGSWSNSHNDARLSYPSGRYTTADLSLVDTSRPLAISVSAAHASKMVWPPSAATLTFTGAAPAAITDVSASANVSGTNTFDGVSLTLPTTTFADYSRLRLAGGSVAALGANSKLSGMRCGIELSGGASISFVTGARTYTDFCNDAELILNGGTVSNAGYFTWSGAASPIAGHVVFGPEGGEFISPLTHRFVYAVTTPLELRYELPGRDWRGYARAPLRLGFVNSDHYFGGGNGKVFVNVVKGMAQSPSRACRIKLIDTTHSNANIITNGFTFAAFGESLVAGETSSKGEKFLWTYDHGDSLEPATPGSRPTGLVFDYAGRRDGLVILLK
ncbi:MAG: hypothetical protein IJQ73_02595 [Kiritimatiellae bacterium]|nr:hypothetical protein [Kiritimatiellia bacterium]